MIRRATTSSNFLVGSRRFRSRREMSRPSSGLITPFAVVEHDGRIYDLVRHLSLQEMWEIRATAPRSDQDL
jgi:hypothetical protein